MKQLHEAVVSFVIVLLFSVSAFAADREEESWKSIEKSLESLYGEKPTSLTTEGLEKFNQQMTPKAGALADQLAAYLKQFPAGANADDAWSERMELLNFAARRDPERKKQLELIEQEHLADPKLDRDRRKAIHSNQLNRTPNVAERERLLRTLESQYKKEAWFYCQEMVTLATMSEYPHSLELVEEVLKNPALSGGAIRDDAEALKAALHRINKPLELKFTTLDGKPFDLKDYRGKVVLLDYWATWCPPCIAGLPRVSALWEKFHGEGFEVIGMSYDTERDVLERFVKKQKLPWPQYFDEQGQESALIKSFGSPGPPAYWLIDREGKLVDINADSEMEAKVKRLLGNERTEQRTIGGK